MLNPSKIRTETEIQLEAAEARNAMLENLTDRLALQVSTLTEKSSAQSRLLGLMAIGLQSARLQLAYRKLGPAWRFGVVWRSGEMAPDVESVRREEDYSAQNGD